MTAARLLTLALASVLATTATAEPLGNAITYQGRLDDQGVAVNEPMDVIFEAFDAEVGGVSLGTAALDSVDVAGGVFTVQLDFGDIFTGDAVWLGISVRPHDPGDTEPYIDLTPRQPLTATPFAHHATRSVWEETGSGAAVNTNSGFVGVNRDYPVGSEWFGVHAPVQTGYGGMYISTEGETAWPFYGYHTGSEAAWHYLDGGDGDWHLHIGGLNRLTVTDEGNVGIGQTEPAYKLDVNGTIKSRSGGIEFPDGSVQLSAAAAGGGNTLDQAYDQGGAGLGRTINATAGAVRIAGADGLSVTDGELSIGAESASYGRLQVVQQQDTSSDGITVLNSAQARTFRFWVDAVNKARIDVGGGTGELAINSAGGNVGIGTADPDVRLHVATGTDVGPASGGYIMAGGLGGLNVALDNNEIMARDNGVPAALHLQNDGGNVVISNAAGTGRLGIQTDTPRAELEVAGGVHVGGTTRDISWNPGETLQMGHYDGTTFTKLAQLRAQSSASSFQLFGANGNYNLFASSESANGDHGWLDVSDSAGNPQAGFYVNSSGNGVVWGDTKNFRVANPRDANTELWYACVEGPEAAAYVRGTASLVNGRATVSLPTHFQDVAVAEGMTVQLTARSGDSEGLAVVSRGIDGFEVRELRRGTGSYEFDWEVKAVRKGHEDYDVVRAVTSRGRAESPPSAQ